MSMQTLHLKQQLRATLPEAIFEPYPLRGILYLVLMPPAIFLIGWSLVYFNPPWYNALPLSLLLGQLYAAGGFIAHEASHGAIFRSKRATMLLTTVGFLPFLISPTLWMFWHCQCHHGFTNASQKDPDVIATLADYECDRNTYLRSFLSPGTHHWISYLGLFCLFTLEGQYVLWLWHETPALAQPLKFNQRRAQIETLLIFSFWALLAIGIGPKASLLIILLPMAVANFNQIAYVMTQHFLRPLTSNNEPLANTVSVTVPPFFNWMHLNFGYHVEHHLFPNMCSKFAPQVSQRLQVLCTDEYIQLPFLQVFRASLSHSRIYFDETSLIVPATQAKYELSNILSDLQSTPEKDPIPHAQH